MRIECVIGYYLWLESRSNKGLVQLFIVHSDILMILLLWSFLSNILLNLIFHSDWFMNQDIRPNIANLLLLVLILLKFNSRERVDPFNPLIFN